MTFDVLISTRTYDKGLSAARKNVEIANIPVNRILVDTSKPVSYSRYKLFQKAETEWVVTFDDDVEVEPDWLQRLLPFTKFADTVGVEGLINYPGIPRKLRVGERSYGCWNALLKSSVFKEWKPDKWMRSWEDYSIGQHALKFGSWWQVPISGKHNATLNVKSQAIWSGMGNREVFGARSIFYFFKLGSRIPLHLYRSDWRAVQQNMYTMKGILKR